MAFIAVSLMVVLTILFIAGIFEDLPEAVLGAIVIHSVAGMIDFRKLARLWKASLPDFWLALGALLGVVVIGILAGIIVGIVASLILLMHRVDHPHTAVLARDPETGSWVDQERLPDAEGIPDVLIYRLEAPWIFANSDFVTEDIRSRIGMTSPSPQTVILDFEAIYEIDTQGTDALLHLRADLGREGVDVRIARAHGAVIDYLRRDGTLKDFGEHNVFTRIADAVTGRTQ